MSFLDRFSKGGLKVGDTKETIIKQMLGRADYETATEIPAVLPMVAFDLLGLHFMGSEEQRVKVYEKRVNIKLDGKKRLDSGDYLWFIGDRFRIDAIPFKRKSRAEAASMVKGVEAEQDRKRSALAGMFS